MKAMTFMKWKGFITKDTGRHSRNHMFFNHPFAALTEGHEEHEEKKTALL